MIKHLMYEIPKGGIAQITIRPTEDSWDGLEQFTVRGEGVLVFSREPEDVGTVRKYSTIESFLEALVEGLEDGGDK